MDSKRVESSSQNIQGSIDEANSTQKVLDSNPKRITKWFLRAVFPIRKHVTVIIEGLLLPNEIAWKSSPIEKVVNRRTVYTFSKSVYQLEGEMNIEESVRHGFSFIFSEYLKSGFPDNWQFVLYNRIENGNTEETKLLKSKIQEIRNHKREKEEHHSLYDSTSNQDAISSEISTSIPLFVPDHSVTTNYIPTNVNPPETTSCPTNLANPKSDEQYMENGIVSSNACPTSPRYVSSLFTTPIQYSGFVPDMPELPLEINGNVDPSLVISTDGRNVYPMDDMGNKGMNGMTMVSTGIPESSYQSNSNPSVAIISDLSNNLPKTKENGRKTAKSNKKSGNEGPKRKRGTIARKNIELKAPFKEKPNDQNASGFYDNSFDAEVSKSAYIQMISSRINQLNQEVGPKKKQTKPEITKLAKKGSIKRREQMRQLLEEHDNTIAKSMDGNQGTGLFEETPSILSRESFGDMHVPTIGMTPRRNSLDSSYSVSFDDDTNFESMQIKELDRIILDEQSASRRNSKRQDRIVLSASSNSKPIKVVQENSRSRVKASVSANGDTSIEIVDKNDGAFSLSEEYMNDSEDDVEL